MRVLTSEKFLMDPSVGAAAGTCRIGKIVEVDGEGRALVDYPGNRSGPTVAKTIVTIDPETLSKPLDQPSVLIVFDGDNTGTPIIVGLVQSQLINRLPAKTAGPKQAARNIHIDGERLTLEAEQEIVLRCGEGSIILKKDGKVIVKGVELVSRASRSNKIKGASVNIN